SDKPCRRAVLGGAMRRPRWPQYVEYWDSLRPCLAPSSTPRRRVITLRRTLGFLRVRQSRSAGRDVAGGAEAAHRRSRRPSLTPLPALARVDRLRAETFRFDRGARRSRRGRLGAGDLRRARAASGGRRRWQRALEPALARRAGRVAEVRRADHDPRL